MLDQNSNLIKSFFTSIFNELSSVTSDIIEIPLDSLIKNDLLRDIPLLGSLLAIGKSAVAVRDLLLLKKMLIFLSKVNSNDIDKSKRILHKEKLESDPQKMQKEIEFLIAILDNFIEVKKSVILGNIYLKYVSGDDCIKWKDVCILSELLQFFSIYDIETLLYLYNNKLIKPNEICNILSLNRLSSLGLITFASGMILTQGDDKYLAKINAMGDLFVKIALIDIDGNAIKFY